MKQCAGPACMLAHTLGKQLEKGESGGICGAAGLSSDPKQTEPAEGWCAISASEDQEGLVWRMGKV